MASKPSKVKSSSSGATLDGHIGKPVWVGSKDSIAWRGAFCFPARKLTKKTVQDHGSVQFSTDKLNRDDMWFCHCSQCRKNYGMYGAFVGIPRKELKISGGKNIHWYKSSQKFRRGFCKKCGSGIFWDNPKWKSTYLLAGLFEKLNRKKGIHIFTKNKGGYYNICDSLPQFKTVPK